ncbi:MAG: hypothetical protein V1798_11695 [Pseudomonadota bacterium]
MELGHALKQTVWIVIGLLFLPAAVQAQAFDTGRDPLTPTDKFSAETGYLALPDGGRGFHFSLADASYLGPNRDLLIEFELPVEHFRPDTAGLGAKTGLGDIGISFGHVIFGSQLSHLIAVGGVLNTATSDVLGKGRWAIVPTYGISWAPVDWFTQVVLADWKRSLSEESGVTPLNRLVFRSRSIFRFSEGFYSSIEATPSVDFQRDGKRGLAVGGRMGIMLGALRNLGFFVQGGRPLDSYTRATDGGYSAAIGIEVVESRGAPGE